MSNTFATEYFGIDEEKTPEQNRAAIIETTRLSVSWVFIPFSQSRNADEKQPSLNWRYTLTAGGRHVHSGDYTAGSGHCPAYKSKRWGGDTVQKHRAIRDECETGKVARPMACTPNGYIMSRDSIPAPSIDDLLFALITDSSADEESFSEWCANLGYSDDSISARKTYDECVEIGRALRVSLGHKILDELRTTFEDY